MQRVRNYGFLFSDGREHNLTVDLEAITALQVVEGTKRTEHYIYLQSQDWIQVVSSEHNDAVMSRLYQHWQEYKNGPSPRVAKQYADDTDREILQMFKEAGSQG